MTRNRSFEVHASCGAALASLVMHGGVWWLYAALAAYAAGWLWEGAQALFEWLGTYDPWDAHYTGAGGLLGALAALVASYA